MKLSLIVPVYRVELFLNDCVKSIINQSYQDIEVILIDDGSPDSCPKMCDKWAKKDKRIKVVHKQNGGLSSARNAGINVAKGNYVMFIDSDDFLIDNSCINRIVEVIKKENKKVYIAPFKYFINNTLSNSDKFAIPKQSLQHSGLKLYENLVMTNNFSPSACFKIIEREFLLSHKIYFEEGVLSEDIIWSLQLFRCNPTVGYIPFSYYAYRQNVASSITNSSIEKLIKSQLYIIEKFVKDNVYHDFPTKKIEFAYLAYIWCIAVSMLPDLNGDLQKDIGVKLKNYSFLLSYNKSIKIKVLQMIYKMFGLKFLSTILKKYRKTRDKRNIK